jgi:acetylglutamate kinase
MTTLLKLGGELLEDTAAMHAMAGAVRKLAANGRLIVVHGGGRAVDAALRVQGIEPAFVDGLRITDTATLDVVVSTLAGRTNTAFVAALHAAGVRAVGLTGADAGLAVARKADPFLTASGAVVDLGLVGQPLESAPTLLQDLTALGYVPVVASIGVDEDGGLLNVNADTLASHLALTVRAKRLIIAGGTTGVLDANGSKIDRLAPEQIDAMIASGSAHSGMVAKLTACREALLNGVEDVAIVSGRGTTDFEQATGTTIQRSESLTT